jgi:hypothetical protein
MSETGPLRRNERGREGAAATRSRVRSTANRVDLLVLAVLLLPVAAILTRSSALGARCAVLHSVLDARLVGYILEWGFRHLHGSAGVDASIWSPPFFYPVPQILAYSENFFAGYLTYFPLRWLGLEPAQALFAFHVLHWGLTPVVTYLCLRALRFGRWSSFVGAALFSWGWVRFFHIGHIQFSAGYPIPLFFTAMYFAYRRRRPWALVVVAATFLYAWYFSLYTVVFLALGVLALAAFHLLLPGGLREAGRTLRSYRRFVHERPRQAVAVLLLCLTAVALLAPSALLYLEVQRQFGPTQEAEIRNYWGDVLSWVRPPPQHPLLGDLYDDFMVKPTGGIGEKLVFVGWLGVAGLAAPLVGFALLRRRAHALWPRSLIVVSAAGVSLMLIFSSYGGLWPETPFWILHDHLPGVGGVRAPSRIAFVVVWFVAVCLAAHLERLRKVRPTLGWLASGALGVALLAEGVAPLPRVADRCADEEAWNRTERHLCSKIPKEDVGTVLFLPASNHDIGRIVQQTLAMRFSLDCGLRVVNGYSGRRPDLIQPLLGSPPREFPCEGVREILDRVHQESGKGVLIHVDLEPPLGITDYPLASVRECVAPCRAPHPEWLTPQPDRQAEVLVTNPEAACSPPSSP